MAITLTATAGAEAANSYASLAEADGGASTTGYLEGRLDVASWEALSDDQKARCLIQATSIIDSQMLLDVQHEDNKGDLHFPTTECEDDGTLYIPTEVMQATCELALTIANLAGQPAQSAAMQAAGVQAMTEGALSVTFAKSGSSDGNAAWKACSEAKRLLRKETAENYYKGWLVRRASRDITL